MKNKKKFFRVLVGLLGIALLSVFVMGCNNSNSGSDSENLGGNTEVSTQGTVDSEMSTGDSEVVQGTEMSDGTESIDTTEVTEATEETETEETEKKELPDAAEGTLKEEEEILKITPTDDQVNNGSGSNEKEIYTAPAAATAKNPIVKVATGTVPVSFSSGKVPAGKTLYYRITTIKGKCLCIEDKDAYIVCDGKTYNAGADGKVLVDIKSEELEIAIGNKATSAKSFKVIVDEAPLGSYGNPYVVASLPDDGVVVSEGIKAETAVYYKISGVSGMILTIEDATAYVIYKDKTYKADDNGIVTVKLDKADGAVLFQIGNSGKTDAKVYNMNFAYASGSEQNPITLELSTVSGGVTCEVEVPAGETLYYNSNAIGGTELTICDVTANVIYKGTTYAVQEGAEVVTVIIESTGNNREPINFAIKNTGTALAKYELVFTYPEGSYNNPVIIGEAGAYSHEFVQGDEAYYYQWTAQADGTMTFDIGATVDVGWEYSISKDAEENPITDGPYYSDADEKVLSKTYTVKKDDVFIIKVSTYEAEASATPAGLISFQLTFATTVNTVTATSPNEEKIPENTEVIENTENVESTENMECTEMFENTESTEVIESTEDIENMEVVENEEKSEDIQTVEVIEPLALHLIRNWCIKLFSR